MQITKLGDYSLTLLSAVSIPVINETIPQKDLHKFQMSSLPTFKQSVKFQLPHHRWNSPLQIQYYLQELKPYLPHFLQNLHKTICRTNQISLAQIFYSHFYNIRHHKQTDAVGLHFSRPDHKGINDVSINVLTFPYSTILWLVWTNQRLQSHPHLPLHGAPWWGVYLQLPHYQLGHPSHCVWVWWQVDSSTVYMPSEV